MGVSRGLEVVEGRAAFTHWQLVDWDWGQLTGLCYLWGTGESEKVNQPPHLSHEHSFKDLGCWPLVTADLY